MNWEAIGAIGEILGAIAVFATLVYLARQIQQSNQATRAAVESQLGEWWSANNRLAITDPNLIEVIETGLTDIGSLSDEERRRFTWWLASLFYKFDNAFTQYQFGILSEKTWQSTETTMLGFLSNEAVQLWWDSGFLNASPEFIDHVNQLKRSGRTGDWQWVDIARVYDDA